MHPVALEDLEASKQEMLLIGSYWMDRTAQMSLASSAEESSSSKFCSSVRLAWLVKIQEMVQLAPEDAGQQAIADVFGELASLHSGSVLMAVFTMLVTCGSASGGPTALMKVLTEIVFITPFVMSGLIQELMNKHLLLLQGSKVTDSKRLLFQACNAFCIVLVDAR